MVYNLQLNEYVSAVTRSNHVRDLQCPSKRLNSHIHFSVLLATFLVYSLDSLLVLVASKTQIPLHKPFLGQCLALAEYDSIKKVRMRIVFNFFMFNILYSKITSYM